MSNLKIEKKYNKFLYCDTYYIYNGNYYLEIGNKDNLKLLFHLILDYQSGKINNKSNNFFKLNYNPKFFYITYKVSGRSLGILKEDVDKLCLLLHTEVINNK